jgi:hypothetical protein
MHSELSRRLVQPGVFDDEAARNELITREAWAKGFGIAQLHAQVFNTEAGERLLQLWIRNLWANPIVRAGEDAFAQGIREGRADLVRQVLVQLEIARQGQPGESP